jgi:hypothetical protein
LFFFSIFSLILRSDDDILRTETSQLFLLLLSVSFKRKERSRAAAAAAEAVRLHDTHLIT